MQLNLFTDSRDVVLRNDAVIAARRQDVAALQSAITALSAALPGDRLLPDLAVLLAALTHPVAGALDAGQGRQALLELETLAQAARRVLGKEQQPWMAARWMTLARAVAHLPFQAHTAALHPAALLLRGEHWVEAQRAIETIPSWRRQPLPLAWHVHCTYRLEGLDAALPLLAELAWMDPDLTAEVIAILQDPVLTQSVRDFEQALDGDAEPTDLGWWPAYLLIELPQCAATVRSAQPGAGTAAERALRTVLELQVLERQGRQKEQLEARRILRELHAGLFGHYLRKR